MTITRKQVDQWRAQRAVPNTAMIYTPDGSDYARVVSCVAAEKERRILMAERAFKDAKRDMRRDQQLSRLHGHAKAVFNNPEPNVKQRMKL